MTSAAVQISTIVIVFITFTYSILIQVLIWNIVHRVRQHVDSWTEENDHILRYLPLLETIRAKWKHIETRHAVVAFACSTTFILMNIGVLPNDNIPWPMLSQAQHQQYLLQLFIGVMTATIIPTLITLSHVRAILQTLWLLAAEQVSRPKALSRPTTAPQS